MVQQLCLWKWFTVGTALAAVLARALAQNDEGKGLAEGVELWEGWMPLEFHWNGVCFPHQNYYSKKEFGRKRGYKKEESGCVLCFSIY